MNLERERHTVERMIAIYCRGHHAATQSLCDECRELRDYANLRIEGCPFQEDKPVCAKCAVHCYKPAMRERIRQVMRYAGPRMLFKHPMLAIFHLLHRQKNISS